MRTMPPAQLEESRQRAAEVTDAAEAHRAETELAAATMLEQAQLDRDEAARDLREHS